MNEVLGVELYPYGSDFFGTHLFDGTLEEWTGQHRAIQYIRRENLCAGRLEISSTEKITLECNACKRRYRTRIAHEAFETLWALMSLQIRYCPLLGENEQRIFRQFTPRTIVVEKCDEAYHSSAFFWHDFAPADFHLAIPKLVAHNPQPKNWEGRAFFEVIRAATSIHGATIKRIKESVEETTQAAHSAFGWLYQR